MELGLVPLRQDQAVDVGKRSRITPLPVQVEHGLRAGTLPSHHRDPFDRLLIAQAQIERLTILTADPQFTFYDVQLIRT